MTDQFSIENMKAELARALNKADEDAKTIADLTNGITNFIDKHEGVMLLVSLEMLDDLRLLLTNNKPNIDFPILLQDEAG